MPYPRHLLDEDELVVREFRPHWSRIIKEILLSVAVAVVLLLGGVILDLPSEGWIMAGIAVVWLLVVAGGVARWFFTQHVITSERVIYRAGVFSRQGKEIPLEVINDVSFNQSVSERIIGSGDLLIESAGELGQSHYRDIPHPERIQMAIYQVREDRMLSLEGGNSGTITRAQQLEILARLHADGRLTDEEFEQEKRAILEGAN